MATHSQQSNGDHHQHHQSSSSINQNQLENQTPALTFILSRRSKFLPWIILAFSAMNVIFLGGKRRAFGIFVAELHIEFNNTSLAELNWIGDSYAAVGYLTSTLSSACILFYNRRFALFQFFGACFVLLACITSAYVPSPHWLFITHTILHGIGSSLILSTVGLVVNEHFDKNHKYHLLATTLVSGGSVASIVFVQVYAYLIETYGWRHSFIILGIVYFFVTGSASLVFTKNESLPDYRDKKCSLNFQGNVKSNQIPLLILWTLDRTLTSIVTYGMLLNLADYMRRREPTLTRSALLTLLFAAGEASTYAIGTVTTAVTKGLLKNRLQYVLAVSTFFMGGCLILWEFTASDMYAARTLAFLSGFFLGPSITFLFPAGEEITTLPGHLAYPFTLAGMGLGMSLSPTLSAVIAQAFQYKWFFMVQGILIYIKFFCLLAAIFILRYYHPMGFQETLLNQQHHSSGDDEFLLSESKIFSNEGIDWCEEINNDEDEDDDDVRIILPTTNTPPAVEDDCSILDVTESFYHKNANHK